MWSHKYRRPRELNLITLSTLHNAYSITREHRLGPSNTVADIFMLSWSNALVTSFYRNVSHPVRRVRHRPRARDLSDDRSTNTASHNQLQQPGCA